MALLRLALLQDSLNVDEIPIDPYWGELKYHFYQTQVVAEYDGFHPIAIDFDDVDGGVG